MEYQNPYEPGGSVEPAPNSAGKTRLVVLVLAAIAIAGAIWMFRDYVSLQWLAEQEARLTDFQQEQPLVVFGIAFLIYVAVTALSIPGATGLTLTYGWLFGFWPALVLVSFASTSGATLAFLLSRYLFRDAIQNRYGNRLRAFHDALEREGAFYLFTLRLIPAAPFFVINAVMGLTRLRVWTFWWVSQVGMLAGTTVYVYAGSSVPDLQVLAEDGLQAAFSPSQITQIFVALVLLGVFPLAVKKVMARLRPSATESNDARNG